MTAATGGPCTGHRLLLFLLATRAAAATIAAAASRASATAAFRSCRLCPPAARCADRLACMGGIIAIATPTGIWCSASVNGVIIIIFIVHVSAA